MSRKVLLSICIPTYNRANYLKNSINSIIRQKEFDERIEIIISDNCSDDDTEKISNEYARNYSNIKYFKNENNIADRNFPLVLNKASGIFRKLCNDTTIFKEGSLAKILEIIDKNENEKPVIFFTNNSDSSDIQIEGLNAFLRTVSFNITWIGGLGIWGEDYKYTEEGCEEKLWQVPLLLNYITERKRTLIINQNLFTIQKIDNKNISYGLYKVFYENYLGYIRKYLNESQITQSTFDWLEEDLLFNFFMKWMYNYEIQKNSFNYSKSENLISCVVEKYKNKKYYKRFLFKYALYKFKMNSISIITRTLFLKTLKKLKK